MPQREAINVPSYRELPIDKRIDERTAWGIFGQADEIGTLNHLSDDRVQAAATEIRTGKRIGLNLPINLPDPPISGGQAERTVPQRHVIKLMKGSVLDDRLDEFWLQGSTQWDGLSHVRHREVGFYNGASDDEVEGPAMKLGIHTWQPGVVGRGVLIDLPRWASKVGIEVGWDQSFPVTTEILEDILAMESVDLRDGDILMLRTGWLPGFLACDPETQVGIATTLGLSSPGLHPTDKLMEFLWDHKVSAVAADNPSVEVSPPQGTTFGHWKLLPLFGFALGELWWLEDLAADSEADGRYTSFITSVPLNVPGGCGSPANAIAIK